MFSIDNLFMFLRRQEPRTLEDADNVIKTLKYLENQLTEEEKERA